MLIQSWFIRQFLDPVFKLWLSSALLSGAITAPGGSPLPAAKLKKFLKHEFMGRRWQWVDPLKDINASIMAINNGITSPQIIAGQQGLDANDVLDQIARFRKLAKEKGVVLAKASSQSSMPSKDNEEEEPGKDEENN